jgi:predicted amidohydrolase
MKIFVALWSRRVYKETWQWDDWSRWFFLECAALRVRLRIPWEVERQGGGFHSIFAAPEYYFSAPRQSDTDPRAIDKDAKDQLLVKLKAMSLYHRGTILVPGTVSYRKPLTTERATKAIAALKAANPGKSFQGSELDNVKHGKEITKWNAKVEMLKPFATGGLGAPRGMDIVTNKAYVLLNGEKIFTYSKKTDVYEALGDDSGIFVPGAEGKTCSTTIGTVPFAFEICGDHEMGVLGAQSRKRLFTKPKIHVICSAFVETKPENSPVVEGGFIVHVSSERRITTVLVHEGAGFKADGSAKIVKHDFTDTVNGDPIDYWTVTLD